MKRLFSVTAFVVTLAFAGPTLSESGEPDALLKALTSEILGAIAHHKHGQADASIDLAKVIELKIEPHFDVTRMTQIAMGANWQRATAEQQKQLTAEFRQLLIHTYSVVLRSYRNQSIDFKPLQAAPADSEVTVRSIMKQPGASPLTIDYHMAKTEGAWKVYEITIDGINTIGNYRATFAAKVREGGVDHLIGALRDKNRQNASADARTAA